MGSIYSPTTKPYVSKPQLSTLRGSSPLHRKPMFYLGILLTAGLLGLIVFLIVYFTMSEGRERLSYGKLHIVSRNEWQAKPPTDEGTPLHHPVPYVLMLDTDTTNCSTKLECIPLVRYTQNCHIHNKGWNDIGYSFLLGGDGNVYVGRGWDTEGEFLDGYNNRSIGISFIGTFGTNSPAKKQMNAGKRLIEKGIQLGKISPDFKLLTQQQFSLADF
ncbi:peptidoglycan-recognition protein SC2-like [Periplaneta americana]|uniref:peptidoglycan-recognition protein SC2-like n=1 Tax=Periplaneta americana TaxID=6978 RepID=UPI0037E79A99